MQVKVKKLHPDAILPQYATSGAACFDLHALTVDGAYSLGAHVYEGYPVVCGTGLAFEVPEGYALMVYSRSGHGFKFNTRLCNAVGILDSDYRGELMVKLTCDIDDDDPCLFVKPGDRIAQAMIVPVPRVELVEADSLGETDRGAGGFGSTGA